MKSIFPEAFGIEVGNEEVENEDEDDEVIGLDVLAAAGGGGKENDEAMTDESNHESELVSFSSFSSWSSSESSSCSNPTDEDAAPAAAMGGREE